MSGFAHEQRLRVGEVRGDPAALGAAVTVGLCGHWEHDGGCRWPHHTSTTLDRDGTADVVVRFDADPAEEPGVRERIVASLGNGALSGPDGRSTTWGAVTDLEPPRH